MITDNNDEIKCVFKSIIGRKLVSVTSDFIDSSFGHVFLRFDDFVIDLKNEQAYKVNESEIFAQEENVAEFSCERIETDSSFESMLENNVCVENAINSIVKSVSIVVDHVYENSNHVFDIINGIIVKTEKHTFSFGKGIWFSEDIFITVDEDEIGYDIDSETDDLSNSGEYDISIIRENLEL